MVAARIITLNARCVPRRSQRIDRSRARADLACDLSSGTTDK